MCAAALLSPHCFPKPPHAANRNVYHLRPSHIGKWVGRVARVVEGLPG
jgi:hypothetical protein